MPSGRSALQETAHGARHARSRPTPPRRSVVWVVLLLVVGAVAFSPSPIGVFASAVAATHPGAARITVDLVFGLLDLAAYMLLVPRRYGASARIPEGLPGSNASVRSAAPSGEAGIAWAPGGAEGLFRGYVTLAFAAAPVVFGICVAGVLDAGHVSIWWLIALVLGWAVVAFSVGMRAHQPAGRPGALASGPSAVSSRPPPP